MAQCVGGAVAARGARARMPADDTFTANLSRRRDNATIRDYQLPPSHNVPDMRLCAAASPTEWWHATASQLARRWHQRIAFMF